MPGSLYDILGVDKSQTCAEIKKAYFKLARTHHPDKGGDPERFKEISQASEILTDEAQRRIYDETGSMNGQPTGGHGFHGFPGFPQGGFPPGGFPFEMNLNDLFGNMFGNQNQRGVRKGKKPAPTIQTIVLTLSQFYVGHTFEININRQCFCVACDHSGATSKERCRACAGQGSVSQVVQMGPMAVHTTSPCLDCQGKGEKVLEVCAACTGSGYTHEKRVLSIQIPPGTVSGQTMTFPEVCSDHPAYERPGDAQIHIQEDTNDPAFTYFKRVGDRFQHLETRVTLSLSEALLGCVVRVDGHPGYSDGLFLQIPAGTFQGDSCMVTGLGMPLPYGMGGRGDLYVGVDVTVSPSDREHFLAHGRGALEPLFADRVRPTTCSKDTIHVGTFRPHTPHP
jgi:DnaJ family protein A protein 2